MLKYLFTLIIVIILSIITSISFSCVSEDKRELVYEGEVIEIEQIAPNYSNDIIITFADETKVYIHSASFTMDDKVKNNYRSSDLIFGQYCKLYKEWCYPGWSYYLIKQ